MVYKKYMCVLEHSAWNMNVFPIAIFLKKNTFFLVEPFKLLIFKMIPATVAMQLHQKRERVILGFMAVLIFF